MYKKLLLTIGMFNTVMFANNVDSDFEEFEEFEIIKEKDEYENEYIKKYNEWMTEFNYNLYSYTLIPLIETYEKLPEGIKKVVDNFLTNVTKPYSIINNILQDNPDGANKELRIFLINSTVGVLGINDIAEEQFGLKDNIETIKTTANKYELPHGYYLVLPIIGPTTIRNFMLDQIQMSYVNDMYGFNVETNKSFIMLNGFNKSRSGIKNLKLLDKNHNKHEIIKRIYLNK